MEPFQISTSSPEVQGQDRQGNLRGPAAAAAARVKAGGEGSAGTLLQPPREPFRYVALHQQHLQLIPGSHTHF